MIEQLKWDEKTNKTTLITKRDDGSILAEPLTSEEASLWLARNKY